MTKRSAIALLVAVASGDPVPGALVSAFLDAILATPGVGEAVQATRDPDNALHHATRAAASFLKVEEALGARRAGHDR